MNINPVDILQYVLNTIVLFFILRSLVYKPVTKFMKNREDRISKQQEDINARIDDANKIKSEYTSLLDQAKAEAEKIATKAAQEAEKEARKIVEIAKQDAEALIKAAREQAAAEKNEAMQSLQAEVGNISVELAAKILKREVSLKDNRKIIDEYFRKVG